jgi:hypothetical protein
VARASLDELLEDYLDYLKAHDLPQWPINKVSQALWGIKKRKGWQ